MSLGIRKYEKAKKPLGKHKRRLKAQNWSLYRALTNTEKNCGLYKMRGFSSLTQELLELQEGLF